MALPGAEQARIPRAKLVDYLLSPTHPEGAAKARFFEAHGYRRTSPEDLEATLRDVARTGDVVETVRSRYGRKYIVEGTVRTPAGPLIRLRAVWIVPVDEWSPRFVTAYPVPRTGG